MMTRYGMLINTRRCVGCYACRIACQMRNGLGPTEGFIHFEHLETGSYPAVHAEVVPLQCMHCADAPCQRVCPTNATHVTDSGVVLVDESRCIGCKYCMAACPYDARIVVGDTGVVEKCRFCYDTEADAPDAPSCVKTCITACRVFGDLDDLDSEISQAVHKYNALPLAGNLTESKIFYAR